MLRWGAFWVSFKTLGFNFLGGLVSYCLFLVTYMDKLLGILLSRLGGFLFLNLWFIHDVRVNFLILVINSSV